jgi:predicted Holliday junction resolvase-like endonuclease
MTIELILVILLGLFVFILIGVALHLAKTIEQLRQYISELERDLRSAGRDPKLSPRYNPKTKRYYDTAADHQ